MTIEASEHARIQNVVDQIWQKYDTDRSGTLDREQVKTFMQETTEKIGCKASTEEEIDGFFAQFDTDKDGVISK